MSGPYQDYDEHNHDRPFYTRTPELGGKSSEREAGRHQGDARNAEPIMGQYRVCVREADNQLFELHVIEAKSDAAALAVAEWYVVDGGIEVWQQDRMIAVLSSKM